MKKAAGFLKQIINKLTMELKRKTRAFKTRLVIFSLLHSSSFSHKLKGLTTHQLKSQGQEETKGKAVMVYDAVGPVYTKYEIEEEEEKTYQIEMSTRSNEDKGEEFRLEEEIDRLADLFIRRFHRQMWLQKQLSLEGQHQDPDDHTPPPTTTHSV